MENSRNIEIKAKFDSDDEYNQALEIAKQLQVEEEQAINDDEIVVENGSIIKQHDVYFNVTNGRLKLRFLKDNEPPQLSQLVQYERADHLGPKLSTFNVYELDAPDLMHSMLKNSLGIRGEVKKTRTLFIHKKITRIHFDEVEGLGKFLEFEVCLPNDKDEQFGMDIADHLMKIFKIKKENLITHSYIDELLK